METLIYNCKTQVELLRIAKLCIKSNISFEFMNKTEIYFFIYDDLDFDFKQAVLGAEIIDHKNKA